MAVAVLADRAVRFSGVQFRRFVPRHRGDHADALFLLRAASRTPGKIGRRVLPKSAIGGGNVEARGWGTAAGRLCCAEVNSERRAPYAGCASNGLFFSVTCEREIVDQRTDVA